MSFKIMDESKEFIVTIDPERNVSALPTKDGKSIVLVVEDPVDVALVQMKKADLGELIAGLVKLHEGLTGDEA